MVGSVSGIGGAVTVGTAVPPGAVAGGGTMVGSTVGSGAGGAVFGFARGGSADWLPRPAGVEVPGRDAGTTGGLLPFAFASGGSAVCTVADGFPLYPFRWYWKSAPWAAFRTPSDGSADPASYSATPAWADTGFNFPI